MADHEASELVAAVRAALAAAGDPAKAPAMQAYMKSAMPYHGVRLPEVRQVCRPLVTAHPLTTVDAYEAAVGELFVEAVFREERYAAVFIARHRSHQQFQTPDRLPFFQRLIAHGAWWDTVDEIAAHRVGPLLLSHPWKVRPVLVSWITDDDLWLRRTAIIAQLNAGERTDLALLTRAIDANIADRDFFIRKAIGWALRQYARTDPEWVRAFVAERADRLSSLSKREARKHLSDGS